MIYMVGSVEEYVNAGEKRIAAFRLLDTKTGKTENIRYERVLKSMVYSGLKIENLRVENGKIETFNGSIKRYAQISPTKGISNEDSIVILWKNESNVFTCTDYRGYMYRVSERDLVNASKSRIIANGKVVRGRISAIAGSHPIKESSVDSVISGYYKKCAVLGIKPLWLQADREEIMVVGVGEGITDIVIPRFVSGIGDKAFKNNSRIRSVTMGDNVRFIGYEAFKWCTGLEKVILPEAMGKIEVSAFDMCYSLKEVIIPKGIKEIPKKAFRNCESLERVIIPKGVEVIGDYAFTRCTSLKNIEIPEGVKRLEQGAFEACSSLKEITIPNGVKHIGTEAFSRCSSLKRVITQEGLKDIQRRTFSQCESLEEVTLGKDVKYVGQEAFSHSGLNGLHIKGDAIEIERDAFRGCMNLDYIKAKKHIIDQFNKTMFMW